MDQYPYKVYYMSSNLEHVLHNVLNASDDVKESLAHHFHKKYRNDLDGFIDYISNSSFSVKEEYITSWDFIKQNNNSLKRYTNINLCFVKNKDQNIQTFQGNDLHKITTQV